MKNKIFTKGIRLLITALLLTAVLVSRRDLSQKIMVALCATWLAVNAWPFLWKPLKRLLGRTTLLTTGSPATEELPAPVSPAGGLPPETPAAAPCPAPEALPSAAMSDTEEAAMLQHISLRLSDKLKSAYPQATWQWANTPPLSAIFKGSTIRIAVDNMDRYTHADIVFDRYGRIHIEPMAVGSFPPAAPMPGAADGTAEEPPSDKPDIIDVSVWYQLVGQKILDKAITELNAGGLSRLAIKENGDITILRQKKEVVKDTLDAFPPKQYWGELVELLEEYQLTAKNLDDRITVSWA